MLIKRLSRLSLIRPLKAGRVAFIEKRTVQRVSTVNVEPNPERPGKRVKTEQFGAASKSGQFS